jgi:hypothetical protein
LKVWKFEVEGVTTQPQQSPQQTITPSQPDILPKEDEGNELPF